MRFYRAKIILLTSILVLGFLGTPAQAETLQLTVADDKATGYNRALFKHWIDVDKDGCDTRAEVLIEEAIVKPKIGSKCKLTGGKWLSAYDGKTVTNASQLDVDHMVPLAEAWDSGASKWDVDKRQVYANDVGDVNALIAVTATTNRSKSDQDPAEWLPAKDVCTYIKNWVHVKLRWSLTVDDKELKAIKDANAKCPKAKISVVIVK